MQKIDTFQNRLLKAMEENDLTCTGLSKKCGISKSRISRYMRGEYLAKQDALVVLGEALNVSEVWLMGYDVDSKRAIVRNYVLADKEIELIETYRSFNEEGKTMVFNMLKDLSSVPRLQSTDSGKNK